MMQDLLAKHYGVNVRETIDINGNATFINDEYVYLTTTASNKEVIHMEQASLAYHLIEKGYEQAALPIQNTLSQWITEMNNEKYIVMKVLARQNEHQESPGKKLAVFHYINRSYAFQPKYISSYGQWKVLWIEKLNYFEERITTEAEAKPNRYYQLLMDVLPYLIGISENGIQYMAESEQEIKFDEGDQGTICFQRYQLNGLNAVILPEHLVYDHRVRDLAEYMRTELLNQEESSIALDNIKSFLSDYEHVYPLSQLSFRLLYARLIYPIQLFDLIEKGFHTDDYNVMHLELEKVLSKQTIYETRLSRLFNEKYLNEKHLDIPLLNWL